MYIIAAWSNCADKGNIMKREVILFVEKGKRKVFGAKYRNGFIFINN